MNQQSLASSAAAIAYIESHLEERLNLDTVASAVRYSKYHLHRMFVGTTGMTPHEYIRRRQLTEAARQLVESRQRILEIALAAGCESQQAFSGLFKALYKKTPAEYRREGRFYPLQLPMVLRQTANPERAAAEIAYARSEDLREWMEFLPAVIGGFPCFEAESHLNRLQRNVSRQQALLLREGGTVTGAAAFSRQTGQITFLAVHPQCGPNRARGLLDFMRREVFPGCPISITTFREGDRADPGQRADYQALGFREAEFLTEFGYPTQRLILPPEGEPRHG